MTEAERWYDHLLGAFVWAIVVIACLMYLRYRADLQARWAGCGRSAVAAFAVMSALSSTRSPQPYSYSFRSASTDRSWPCPMVRPIVREQHLLGVPHSRDPVSVGGYALIVYDRRRTTREEQSAGNLCLKCGYDLRAQS